MNMLSFMLLTFLMAMQQTKAVIRPSATLYFANGEGFIAYLELPKSFGAVEKCSFQFRDQEKIEVKLNSTDPITTDRNELLLPYSNAICGIRVQQLSAASAATWTLFAENGYGEEEKDYLTVHILPAPKTLFDTHVQLDIGKGSIKCTQHETYTKHCKISDSEGKAWHQCDLYATIRPNQTFECRTYNWGRLEESHEHIIVDIKEGDPNTIASAEDGIANVVLRCQFTDTSLHSCQAELPDHKTEFYIMDGLYNGRYSSYDTLTSKSKCALEIPKPIGAPDVGLWRILNYDKDPPAGCLFYVGKSKQEIIEKELELIKDVKIINAYKKKEGSADSEISEMSCVVPFLIEDCYLRDPNNTVYFADTYQFQRTRLYGKCIFHNLPVIAGMWVCGARSPDYDKEVEQEIEVVVKPRGGEVLTELTKVKQGKTVELMCESPFEDPISHCAFISPQGQVHLVGTASSIKTKGHVQYYGRGIAYGECGIKIVEVNSDDYGEWQCQFIIYAGKVQSTFSLQLKESDVAHASSVGLGVGVSVVIVLVLGVIVGTIFYRRRHLTARHNFVSADTLDTSSTLPTVATTEA